MVNEEVALCPAMASAKIDRYHIQPPHGDPSKTEDVSPGTSQEGHDSLETGDFHQCMGMVYCVPSLGVVSWLSTRRKCCSFIESFDDLLQSKAIDGGERGISEWGTPIRVA